MIRNSKCTYSVRSDCIHFSRFIGCSHFTVISLEQLSSNGVYYCEDSKLTQKSFVAISECNQHDTVAVHLYQTRLLNFLKLTYQVTKIFYFSDGCAGQYINCKNFLNLCHHKQDFEGDAKWYFFATSHGEGPCDGIGKELKARSQGKPSKNRKSRTHLGSIGTIQFHEAA